MFESVIIKNQWTIACSSKGNTNTDLKGIVPPSKLLDTDDIVRKAIWKCCLISSVIWTFITANIRELALMLWLIFSDLLPLLSTTAGHVIQVATLSE